MSRSVEANFEEERQHNETVDFFGQKEDTLRDMLDNKMQSHKSSSDSSNISATSNISLQSLNNRGPFLPEPLPLFDGPSEEEPHLLHGFRRPTKIFNSGKNTDGNSAYCPHEEVTDWTCKACKKRIPQFELFCDDYQGRATKFLKVCYENQFLQDFLSEQVIELENAAALERRQQLDAGMSPDAVCNGTREKRNPDIIYQCYQPINVTELREYMLFCMGLDLQASHKMRDEE